MFNYKNLRDRYMSDASFNKSVNLFRQLIEEYGFTPHEVREGLFLAQYMYEIDHVQKYVQTQVEMERAAQLLIDLKKNFIIDADEIVRTLNHE